MLFIVALSAEGWSALANGVLAVGALVTGALGLYTYRKGKRVEAARWLHGMFKDFYLGEGFQEIRRIVEYEYSEPVAPLLERRLANRSIPCSREEQQLLAGLDTLLNYFEQVLYLEGEGHLSRRDRDALFDYWFDILDSDERAASEGTWPASVGRESRERSRHTPTSMSRFMGR